MSATTLTKSSAARERRVLLERELSRWLPLLIAHECPDRIILFGSYVRGEVGEWSDLDMIIVREDPVPFLERIRRVLPCYSRA